MSKKSVKTIPSSMARQVASGFQRLFSSYSMRSKLILLYVATMVVIITLLVLVVQSMGSGILERQTASQLTALASSKADQITTLFQHDLERTSLIASRSQMRASLVELESTPDDPEPSRQRIMAILSDAASSVETIRQIDILNTQGIVVASTSQERINVTMEGKNVFTQGMAGPSKSDFFWDVLQRPYYQVSSPLSHPAPVDDSQNQVIGVVVVEMSLDRFMEVLTDYTGLGLAGELILVSWENNELIALNPLRNQEHLNGQPVLTISQLPFSGQSSWSAYMPMLGSNSLVAFAPILEDQRHWGVLARISADEMLAPYLRLFQYFLAFSITLLAMGIFTILAGIRYSFKHFECLVEGTSHLGEGKLDHRIELTQRDEIGKLAESFNQMAVKLKEHQDQMIYLSFTDQLTGLGNRRFYEEEMIRLDTPGNLPLTILMGDVNGLKLTNDAFGHATGDDLLRTAAGILKSSSRERDVVCRIGGDEFILLLPNTTREEAAVFVDSIRATLSQVRVANVELSISFGHETKEHPREHVQTLLEMAEEKMYGEKLSESKSMRSRTIEVILARFFQDREERRHAHGVAALCESMGKALSFSADRLEVLKQAGLLHDLGNIALDHGVLHQKNPLDAREWSEIKRHPEIGYRILSGSFEYQEEAEWLLGHHEHWDGTGYPRKLSGEEIHLESRIIALAEAYDTMTHEQSYSTAMPNLEAVNELKSKAGSQFDPALVSLFVYKIL